MEEGSRVGGGESRGEGVEQGRWRRGAVVEEGSSIEEGEQGGWRSGWGEEFCIFIAIINVLRPQMQLGKHILNLLSKSLEPVGGGARL